MDAPQSSTAHLTRRERREAQLRAAQAEAWVEVVPDAQPSAATTTATAPAHPDAAPAPLSRRARREAAERTAQVVAPDAAPAPLDTVNHVVAADTDPWQTAVRVLPAPEPVAVVTAAAAVRPVHRSVRGPAAVSATSRRTLVPASVPVPVVAAPVVTGPACSEHPTPPSTTTATPPAARWEQPTAAPGTARRVRQAELSAAPSPLPAADPAPAEAPLPVAATPDEPAGTDRAPGERPRWAPRMAVLTSLAVATIAVPLTGAARGGDAPLAGSPQGPSLLDAVSAQPAAGAAPASVRALAATGREEAASRSLDRPALASCDADGYVHGANGRLDTSQLCELWQKDYYLQPPAARALSSLNDAFRARFGKNICLVAAYRPLATQYELAVTRAGYAATPGTSDHGLGVAIDLCSSMTGNAETYQWLRTNAPVYGWDNPPWARPGGVGAYEPWHFEYYAGVEALGGQI